MSFDSNLVGKTITIFYDDGQQIRKNSGVVKNVTDNLVYLFDAERKKEIAIAISRIVRIEINA